MTLHVLLVQSWQTLLHRPARPAAKQDALHPHRPRHHHRGRLGRGHGGRGQWSAGAHHEPGRRPRAEPAHRLCRQPKSGGVNSGLGSASTITLADADAIRREVTDVAAISPEVSTSAQAIANGRNWSTSIVGESPDYLKIRDWKLAAGSMFTDREVRSAAKVAVIGSKTS